jgi:amino acid adenylation domain-containing protein
VGGVGALSTAALDRYAAQLTSLLRAVSDRPTTPIGELVLLGAGDREQVLAFAGGTAPIPEGTVHARFEAQVRTMPDEHALLCGDAALTFAELNARANRLAWVLRERGVAPDSLVGVCVERSPDAIVASLAVLKAGAAFVPLDPSTLNPGKLGYPRERLKFMIEDVDPAILITQRKLAEDMPESRATLLPIDDREHFEHASEKNPEPRGTADSAAYAIYTSGSTGRPKAVVIEHRSALNLWAGLTSEVYGAHGGRHLRVSLNAPLGFDPSMQQLLMLLSGHTIVLVPEEIRADGRALLELIDRQEVDVWDCTPPQLRLLVAAGLLDADRRHPTLVLCGGEAFDRETWRAVAGARSPAVFNLYGPTECTVDATIAPVEGEDPVIGRPLPNVFTYLLDRCLQPVPVGVAGELYIAGAGVGRGYLNRPALDAERFLADRIVPAGRRMYRTGDVGRFTADGAIEFLGRVDRQVKVRSHRIELAEVERVLGQCPGVRESGVVVVAGKHGESRLVAYYVADPSVGVLTNGTLRQHLIKWLPEYMIPSTFVELDALPLTVNGKLDRDALPEPGRGRPALAIDYMSPRDELERSLVRGWAQVLDLDPDEVGLRDDFFELGGDSLRAVELLYALEESFGRGLPLDLTVQHPTIDQQARWLRSQPQDAAEGETS